MMTTRFESSTLYSLKNSAIVIAQGNLGKMRVALLQAYGVRIPNGSLLSDSGVLQDASECGKIVLLAWQINHREMVKGKCS